jgi:glycosyltransferase involved in cell wall biosynthesis
MSASNPRVLVAHVRYRQAGGEDTVFETEVQLLESAGMDVAVLDLPGANLDAMSLLRLVRLSLSYANHRYGRRLISARIDGYRPDVVHFHNIYPLLGPGAILQAAAMNCTTVMTLHNHRLSCLAGTHVLNGEHCDRCRPGHFAAGIRHACYRGSRTQSALAARATTRQWANFVSLSAPTLLIALTEAMKDQYVSYGGDPDRIIVKNSSVPAGATEEGPRAGVFCAGRLSGEKGIIELMQAWPAGAPLLTVAGAGPMEDGATAIRKPNVRFLGWLPRGSVRHLARMAKVVVVPSLGREPTSLVALEAFSEGTPVVAFAGGALGTVVRGMSVDCTAPMLDFAALAEAAGAMAVSPRWHEVSAACRSTYASAYTLERNLAALESIYARAIEIHGSGQRAGS